MATGRIGTTPVLQVRWSKAPTNGTTSLSGLDDNSVSLVYSVGYEAVYRNGVLLSRGNDYTATNGTTVTLIDATITGDIIEIFANQTVPLSDTFSQTVADGRFIKNTLTTTTGDIIYASGANTPARLGIGSSAQVLTVSGGIPAWAAPSSGGMTLLSTTTLSALSTTISGISGSYKHLVLYSKNLTDTDAGGGILALQFNSDTGSNYSKTSIRNINNSLEGLRELSNDKLIINSRLQTTGTVTKLGSNAVWIYRYTDTDQIDIFYTSYGHTITGTQTAYETGYGQYDGTAAITSITILGSTSLAGTVYLYGVN